MLYLSIFLKYATQILPFFLQLPIPELQSNVIDRSFIWFLVHIQLPLPHPSAYDLAFSCFLAYVFIDSVDFLVVCTPSFACF